MTPVQRKITHRLYPNTAHEARMDAVLALHCRTYNALLEERQRRYLAGEPSFGFAAANSGPSWTEIPEQPGQ